MQKHKAQTQGRFRRFERSTIYTEGRWEKRKKEGPNVLDQEYVEFANERVVQKSSNRRHLLNKDQQDVFFFNLFQ
jgi:hypothetical protein